MATPPAANIYYGDPDDPIETSITIQENTTGFCSVQGTVDNNNAGFTGTGFANTNNAVGVGVVWRINVPSAGTYAITWRHANGGGTDRPGRLLVNGTQLVSAVSFPATTNWTTWTEVSINVSLGAGQNTIRLEATTAAGLSNIDYLKVTGNTPSPVSCSGVTARMATNSQLPEIGSQKITLYPNPSNSQFNLLTPGKFAYNITDQFGRQVERGKGSNAAKVGQRLPAGVYFIRIETESGAQTLKLVKQ